jgi:hypothetical protein
LRPLSPRLHAISTLWMENSHLTDAGIEPLSREIRLTDLTIAGSRMTDAGLDHLASLTSLYQIEDARPSWQRSCTAINCSQSGVKVMAASPIPCFRVIFRCMGVAVLSIEARAELNRLLVMREHRPV